MKKLILVLTAFFLLAGCGKDNSSKFEGNWTKVGLADELVEIHKNGDSLIFTYTFVYGPNGPRVKTYPAKMDKDQLIVNGDWPVIIDSQNGNLVWFSKRFARDKSKQ